MSFNREIQTEEYILGIVDILNTKQVPKISDSRLLEMIRQLLDEPKIDPVRKMVLYDKLMVAYKGDTSRIFIPKSELSEYLYTQISQQDNVSTVKDGGNEYLSFKIGKN